MTTPLPVPLDAKQSHQAILLLPHAEKGAGSHRKAQVAEDWEWHWGGESAHLSWSLQNL